MSSTSVWMLAIGMGLTLLDGGMSGARADFPLVASGRAATLVADGKEAAHPDLAGAIADFRTWVGEASGVRPELITTAGTSRRPAILIGKAAAGTGVSAEEAALGKATGYVIRIKDAEMAVAGPTPGAIASALYDLAARDLGVRVHGPRDEDVKVPKRTTIRLATGERRAAPAFELRQAWYNENVLDGFTQEARENLKRFARRHQAGGVRAVIRHYYAEMIPPAKYFATHPEYFAEVNGKRVADGQLCTSNRHVADLAVEHWKEKFRREPDLRIGSLSPNDGSRFCSCAECLRQGPDLAARIILFMNDVTRRVAAEFPDRYMAFYAYADLVEPPYERGIQLHPNLIPIVARYGVCHVHPIGSAACRSATNFTRQLDGWAAMSRHIMAREYACLWPVPDLTYDVMATNLQHYREQNAIGVSSEYLYRGFLSDILMAVDLELMWSPDTNPDSLFHDLVVARFEDSAPAVEAAVADLVDGVRGLPRSAVVVGDAKSMGELYRPEALEAARNRIEREEAVAAGRSAVIAARLKAEADLLRLAILSIDGSTASDRYKLSGKAADRDAAKSKLSEGMVLAARLETDGFAGANSHRDLERKSEALGSAGLKAPIVGPFDYVDDMNRGGFSRRDADQISGFYPGSYGLALNPRQSGLVAYTFTAVQGHTFTRAEIHNLLLRGSLTAIEVKVRGAVHRVAEGMRLDDRNRIYDLTKLVAGADKFTVTFSAQNTGDQASLCLDHWGMRGEVN